MQLCLGIFALPTDHIITSNTQKLSPWGYRRFEKQWLWNGVASAHAGPAQGPKFPQELQQPVNILTWELVPQAEQFLRAEISKYTFSLWLWHLLGNFKPRNVCATVQGLHLSTVMSSDMKTMGFQLQDLTAIKRGAERCCWHPGRDSCPGVLHTLHTAKPQALSDSLTA